MLFAKRNSHTGETIDYSNNDGSQVRNQIFATFSKVRPAMWAAAATKVATEAAKKPTSGDMVRYHSAGPYLNAEFWAKGELS